MSQSSSAAYIQTGKVTAAAVADITGRESTPTSAKAVRYNPAPVCNVDSDTGSRGSILKKNKVHNSPSVMSMIASDPEPLKILIARPPTYQLGPAKGKHFQTIRINKVVKSILEEHLCNEVYNMEKCKELTSFLTEHIIGQIKRIPMDRYKLVCTVMIGERLGQGIQTGSRCAWDESTDSFTSVTYENKTLYAVATVYGLYTE